MKFTILPTGIAKLVFVCPSADVLKRGICIPGKPLLDFLQVTLRPLSKKVVSSDVSTENEVGFICIYNPGNSAMYASTLLSLLLTFADGVKKFLSLASTDNTSAIANCASAPELSAFILNISPVLTLFWFCPSNLK